MKTTLHARAIKLGARILATYLIALSIPAPLFGQSNPCAEPFKYLKEGIYNRYKEGTSLQKYSSMKDYLKSEDFKQDVKKGGWSGGLTIPIKGVPVSLNAGSSTDKFNEFRSGIEKLSENQLMEAFAQQIEKSEPNTDFVKEYFQCLKENAQGFTWTSERIGKRAFITIRFMPLSLTDPMPVITDDVKVDNASDISAPKKGQQVDLSNVISAVVKDPDQSVTVIMATNKKTVYASSDPSPTPTPTPPATATPTTPPSPTPPGEVWRVDDIQKPFVLSDPSIKVRIWYDEGDGKTVGIDNSNRIDPKLGNFIFLSKGTSSIYTIEKGSPNLGIFLIGNATYAKGRYEVLK